MIKPVNLAKPVPPSAETPPDHFEVLPPEGKARGAHHPALTHLIAYLMDNIIKVPGLRKRIGVNPILDLIPFGVGDGAATLLQVFTILEGARRGLPKIVLARMGMNILVNGAVGIVPGIGEAFSWWFRPSSRNYQLLMKHAPPDGVPVPLRRNHAGDYLFVFGLLATVLVVMAIFIMVGFYVLGRIFIPVWHSLFG